MYIVSEAIKSNQYADIYPARAAKAVELAETYARRANENGQKVDLEIREVNGQRRVITVTIDGVTWVRNGAFVNNPADR